MVRILLDLHKNLGNCHIQGHEVTFFKLLVQFKVCCLLLLRIFLLFLLGDLGDRELGLLAANDSSEIFLLVLELF